MQFESEIKYTPWGVEAVYGRLSDLSNLSSLRDRLDDPMVQQRMQSELPADKLAEIRQRLETMTCDRDTVTVDLPPVGKLTLRIIEREENKTIKMEVEGSPIPATLWIQTLSHQGSQSKLKVTLRAEVNAFMKMMVKGPLQKGVDKLAEMLSMIPYGA